jgi:hypothetical protein
VLAIIIAGFVVSVPISALVNVPYKSVSTGYSPTTSTSVGQFLVSASITVPYVTRSTTVVAVTQTHSTSSSAFGISPVTLGCNEYAHSSTTLTVGEDVQISWSASDTIDVYVFISTEYQSYVNSGTTSPNVWGESSAPASGSLSFHVSGSDTYYLMMHNPHNGVNCFAAENLAIYSATGLVYPAPSVSYITQTVTYITSGQTVITQTVTTTVTSVSTSTKYITFTLTSASPTSCASYFWNWLFGTKNCS